MYKSSGHSDFCSAFYNKAHEIRVLSKAISDYLSKDLSPLTTAGQENPYIYFSGDIVQQSTSLSEQITKAEQTTQTDRRHHHVLTLNWLTYRLIENCKRLEHCNSNGKDFLLPLKIELKKFKSLQKHWQLMML